MPSYRAGQSREACATGTAAAALSPGHSPTTVATLLPLSLSSTRYLREAAAADEFTSPSVSKPICAIPSMEHTWPLYAGRYAAPQ